jgi:hypothetical protein
MERKEKDIFEVKLVCNDSEENVVDSFLQQRPSNKFNPKYIHEVPPIQEDEKEA